MSGGFSYEAAIAGLRTQIARLQAALSATVEQRDRLSGVRDVTVFKHVHDASTGWKTVKDFVGKFHGWGLEVLEQEPASVNYSVAIVEREDGQITTASPHLIKFNSPAEQSHRKVAEAVLDHCYGPGGVSEDMINRAAEVVAGLHGFRHGHDVEMSLGGGAEKTHG